MSSQRRVGRLWATASQRAVWRGGSLAISRTCGKGAGLSARGCRVSSLHVRKHAYLCLRAKGKQEGKSRTKGIGPCRGGGGTLERRGGHRWLERWAWGFSEWTSQYSPTLGTVDPRTKYMNLNQDWGDPEWDTDRTKAQYRTEQ